MKYLIVFCATLFTLHLAAADSAGGQSSPKQETYARANDGTSLTWLVHTPAGKGPWPAVLVIHGGRFLGGDPDDAGVDNCADDLADAGYIAFAISYRLAPPGSIPGQKSDGRYPDQYDDVQQAVLAARTDSRGNGKVGAVGGSAGATHASWVAATGKKGSDRLDVAVGLSGAYDFSDFSPDPNIADFTSAVTNYVGVTAKDTSALRAASPAWQVTQSVAPLFLVDTQDDLMPTDQLDDMVAKLKSAGAKNYDALTLKGSGHSFAYWSKVKADAIDFLAGHLASSKKKR